MEKDRGSRVIAVVALLVAVVGLSIGFAAFTRDLNITFSDSNVNVSGDLDVKFLASDDTEDTTIEIPFNLNDATAAGAATIGNDGLTINGLGATFSNKGQSVEYDFYIYNNSEYDAYLKKVEFLNYTGKQVNKACTALTGTTQGLVDAACEDISLTIAIAGEDVVDTQTSDFTSPMIGKGKTVPVKITINYDGGENSALLPNGDFKINFGGIKLNYSSLVG